MFRFILVFCLLFFLVICDETPDLSEDYVVTKTVKEIISGGRRGQDIPKDLMIVSQFYETPKPELYSKQEISLTCLGGKINYIYSCIFVQGDSFPSSLGQRLLWACFRTSEVPKGFYVMPRLGANYF